MNKRKVAVIVTAAIISAMMASCLVALSNPVPIQKGAQLVAR